jgi:hypothetical protein
MLKVDRQIAGKKGIDEARRATLLAVNYEDNIPVPNLWGEFLKKRVRPDIEKILLIGKHDSPYTLRTSLVNRMLVFGLIQKGHIKYQQGEADESYVQKLTAEGYRVIERIGPENNFYEFFGLTPRAKELKEEYSKKLTKLEIGVKKLYPNGLFENLKREQGQKRILVVINYDDRNNRRRASHFEIALERAFYNNTTFPKVTILELSPSGTYSDINRDVLSEALTEFNYHIIVFFSSDLFYLSGIPKVTKVSSLIFLGEESLVRKAHKGILSSNKTILGLAQDVNWTDICKIFQMINLPRIGFVLNPEYATDRFFYEEFKKFLEKSKFKSSLSINAVLMEELEARKHEFDVITGRYQAHLQAKEISKILPFVSPYRDDIFHGSIVSFDVPEIEIANILIEDFIEKLFIDRDLEDEKMSLNITSQIIKAPGARIYLSPEKAKKYNVDLERLKRISTHFL